MTTLRMNLIVWVALAVGLLAAGAGAGYWWAQRAMSRAGGGADSMAGMTGAGQPSADKRKVLYWHDPMVPNVKFEKPGKSPFMNMQLVPVYADEEAKGVDVRVSPNVMQSLGIRMGKVEKASFQPHLRAVGSVAFDERSLELVQARVEGYITRLYVKAPLAHVRRGQPLADILAPQWLEAQQEYVALLDARSERAQGIREAARARLRVLGVPEATIRAVETQRKTTDTTTIVAPLDGVVTELSVREGAAFMPGASLFRINGMKTVWVNAQIPEAQASRVQPGSTVTAQATAWPGITFKGQVIALLPEVDPQTRTLTVRIALDNPDAKLSPGMFVSLDFNGPVSAPQLTVPSEAVIMTGTRNVVITAGEGGAFDVADVTVGAEQRGRTSILSGLQEGQSIVLSGQFLIDSEASLKSTVNRLEATAAPSAAAPSAAAPPTAAPSAAMSDKHEPSDDAKTALHRTQGRITAITPQQITIAHDPVPTLNWPAMTMGFKVPAAGAPRDLKVGDQVSFSFSVTASGDYQLNRIAPTSMPGMPGMPGMQDAPRGEPAPTEKQP